MNMSLNSSQVDHLRSAIRTGLSPLIRPEPKCLAEWADENFYLSSESSYIEGSWETLPFQVAIMNAMGHPDIEQVNLIKSKRVGYSQMIRAALGYFAEHKKRKHPDLNTTIIESIKWQCVKAQNSMARLDSVVVEVIDEYVSELESG